MIAIIGGAGRVGRTLALLLVASKLKFKQLILCDPDKRVEGEVLDLSHCAAWRGRKIDIRHTSNVADCSGARIIVFAAAGQNNLQILKECLGKLSRTNAIFIIVSNPVDKLTCFAAKQLGRFRVLGISTLTDTARLKAIDKGYAIGQHGGHMAIIGSACSDRQLIEIRERVRKLKGGGTAIAALLTFDVISYIINDSKKELPISVLLDGEFGLKDVALSVPCVIGAQGIERIKEIKLTKEQAAKLAAAAVS